jgi:uncharacterized protein involved in response to NO
MNVLFDSKYTAVSALGFRPFFLIAGLYGVVSIAVWSAVYSLHWDIELGAASPLGWHAHEMVFGYCGAVIAGFLLTAVRNWTGLPTLSGGPLLALVSLWLAARILPFVGGAPVWLIGCFDIGFYLGFVISIGIPLIRTKQWLNLSVWTKVVFILASDVLYYLGVWAVIPNGVYLGIYSGFYLIAGLILMMCRRLIPFFTERGVGYPVTLANSKTLDTIALVLFLLFWIAELALPNHMLGAALSGVLAVLHGIRLVWWHTPGIWKKPLLWILFLAYGFFVVGFVLRTLSAFLPISPFLGLHAFAVGGVGLVTIGMMARVTLGHTGRDIQKPPAALVPVFGLLFLAVCCRVILPLADMSRYGVWIGLSQILWTASFALFVLVYAPMLVKPRVDGAPG